MPVRQNWPYPLGADRIELFLHVTDRMGNRKRVRMLVDTGFAQYCVFTAGSVVSTNHGRAKSIITQYGQARGYAMLLELPQIRYSQMATCYTNQTVKDILTNEGFDGLLGLEFLRNFTYGGDSAGFFLEK